MKMHNKPIIESMVVDDDESIPVSVIEYDDTLAFLWRGMRTCKVLPSEESLEADSYVDGDEEVEPLRTDL